jgi:predicted phage terminase large subunit-like protein
MRTPKINIHEVEAELCRREFYYFVQAFWDVIIPDDYTDNWHIPYVCEQLQAMGSRVILRKEKAHDLIINIPPGTSKSTLCTIMFPVWIWINDPTLKIITGSYSDTLATAHSVKSRDLLKSDKFQTLFPGLIEFKRDSDGKTYYENTKGGLRIATSVGGTITGLHAHIILIDDPVNPKKGASEVERNNANTWFDQTLSTRKVDKKITPIILIQQRVHESDTTGYLLSKEDKKIKHICLPAELSSDVKPVELRENYQDGLLDRNRLDRNVLNDARIDLGSYAYAGQFMQRPAPEGGGIIKRDWFTIISPEQYMGITTKRLSTNFFIDPAYTSNSSKNDPSALLACTVYNNCLYIKDVSEKWLELPALLKYIREFVDRNDYNSSSRIYVEPKASGLSIVQAFKESKLNVTQTEAPKDDKVTRAHSITAFLESGKCFLIGNKKTPWIEKLLTQCSQFPSGSHDDMVDCLIMACSSARSYRGDISMYVGGGREDNSAHRY